MALKSEIFQIYLSDKAFENLCLAAKQTEYIRSTQRARGLGLYLVNLVQANAEAECWTDTRPQHMQEGTIDELEAGQFPSWDNGELRQKHLVFFPQVARTITCALAMELGTIRQHPNYSAGRKLSDSALISQLWEAVGLKWLTPLNPPNVPDYATKPPKPVYLHDW